MSTVRASTAGSRRALSDARTVRGALEAQRRAGTAKGRRQTGAFIVEGQRLLRRACAAGLSLRQLLIAQSAEEDEGMERLVEQADSVVVVADHVLDELSDGRHSGLVQGLVQHPPALSLNQFLADEPQAVLLVLLRVEDPGNVGALIRTALASGAGAVVFAGGADPFHSKAIRTSQGSVFRMRLFEVGSPTTPERQCLDCLGQLRQLGVRTWATSPGGGTALGQVKLDSGPVALLVGHEGQGLSAALQAAADQTLRIEQSCAADSYSVNAAAAICLYEIARRRGILA